MTFLAYLGFPVALATGFFIFILRIQIVQYATAIVISRFGKISRTLTPGWNWWFPIFETPAHVRWRNAAVDNNPATTFFEGTIIPTEEVKHDIPPVTVLTKDNVELNVDMIFYSQIEEPHKAVVCNGIWASLEDYIRVVIQDKMALLLSTKENLREDLNKESLSKAANIQQFCEQYGIRLTRVDIQRISPTRARQAFLDQQLQQTQKIQHEILRHQQEADLRTKEVELDRTLTLMKAKTATEASALAVETQKTLFNAMAPICEKWNSSDKAIFYSTLILCDTIRKRQGNVSVQIGNPIAFHPPPSTIQETM